MEIKKRRKYIIKKMIKIKESDKTSPKIRNLTKISWKEYMEMTEKKEKNLEPNCNRVHKSGDTRLNQSVSPRSQLARLH